MGRALPGVRRSGLSGIGSGRDVVLRDVDGAWELLDFTATSHVARLVDYIEENRQLGAKHGSTALSFGRFLASDVFPGSFDHFAGKAACTALLALATSDTPRLVEMWDHVATRVFMPQRMAPDRSHVLTPNHYSFNESQNFKDPFTTRSGLSRQQKAVLFALEYYDALTHGIGSSPSDVRFGGPLSTLSSVFPEELLKATIGDAVARLLTRPGADQLRNIAEDMALIASAATAMKSPSAATATAARSCKHVDPPPIL